MAAPTGNKCQQVEAMGQGWQRGLTIPVGISMLNPEYSKDIPTARRGSHTRSIFMLSRQHSRIESKQRKTINV